MTFVGKILVIVIMALALLFLGISTVVFTTATNWKDATAKEKAKVQDLTTKNNDASAKLEAHKKDLETATKGASQTKQGLDNRIGEMQAEIERIQKDITAARGEVVTAQMNAKQALDEAEARRNETTLL